MRKPTHDVTRWIGAAVLTAGVLLPVGASGQELAPGGAERAPMVSPLGQAVTVEGQVGELYQPRVFRLDGERAPADEVLVLAGEQALESAGLPSAGTQLVQGDRVRVTGTLEVFNRATLEDTLELEIDAGLAARWTARTVLLATAVAPLAPSVARSDDPLALVGQVATLRGQVVEIVAQQAFVAEVEGRRLLVASAPLPEQRPSHWTGPWARDWSLGDQVAITGEVGVFGLYDYENDYGINLDDNTFAGWEGQPAVFARAVDLVARD